MLVLAFDTATEVATVALATGSEVLAERKSRPVRILEDADGLLGEAGLDRGAIEGLVAGTGPGSYTGLRMGLVTARALAFALEVPVAGVSTLAALEDGVPVVLAAEAFTVRREATYVGDGAVRYRALLEEAGASVPPDDDPVHVPWARHHVALAESFGAPELAEPIYLRLPDAERALAR